MYELNKKPLFVYTGEDVSVKDQSALHAALSSSRDPEPSTPPLSPRAAMTATLAQSTPSPPSSPVYSAPSPPLSPSAALAAAVAEDSPPPSPLADPSSPAHTGPSPPHSPRAVLAGSLPLSTPSPPSMSPAAPSSPRDSLIPKDDVELRRERHHSGSIPSSPHRLSANYEDTVSLLSLAYALRQNFKFHQKKIF